jgi:UDP-N-acetylmuramoyl-L-alanyl-D-glutamate--2,6-diaminopimelate ligase
MPDAVGGGPDGRSAAELIARLRAEGRLLAIDMPSASDAIHDEGDELGGLRITAVVDDSRRAAPGSLFVAVRGLRLDGQTFVREAVARGSVLVAVEEPIDGLLVPQLVVDRGSTTLGTAAAWWYGDPGVELLTVGVTGTNGKTTTTFLAAAALDAAGFPSGLIGTIGIAIGRELIPNNEPMTTPGALALQRTLRDMRLASMTAVVIEASSHGLAADRVAGVDFDAAIFTNLSHEHLDFHGTFDAYRAAKLSLFEQLPNVTKRGGPGVGVVNVDDAQAPAFLAATHHAGARAITYGASPAADVYLRSLALESGSSRLDLMVAGSALQLTLALPGRFNASNAMAVLGLAVGLNIDVDVAARALEAVRSVPGRMERVERGQPFIVVIDYAHTPTALEAVLREIRLLTEPGRGIITVFGASGERDVGKRPLMGRAAAAASRLVIVTEDDSRGEDPTAIHDAIVSGVSAAHAREGGTAAEVLVIPDRAEAIATALRAARAGDVVVLAGKGHETWNVGPGGPEPWSERDVAEAALGALGYDGRGD